MKVDARTLQKGQIDLVVSLSERLHPIILRKYSADNIECAAVLLSATCRPAERKEEYAQKRERLK